MILYARCNRQRSQITTISCYGSSKNMQTNAYVANPWVCRVCPRRHSSQGAKRNCTKEIVFWHIFFHWNRAARQRSRLTLLTWCIKTYRHIVFGGRESAHLVRLAQPIKRPARVILKGDQHVDDEGDGEVASCDDGERVVDWWVPLPTVEQAVLARLHPF